MKFIFPQNYNFKYKLFGIFEFSTIIFNLIWCIFLLIFINLFFYDLYLKIILFITFSFPILLISAIGFNHENFIYVIFYFIKFLKSKKIYLFKK